MRSYAHHVIKKQVSSRHHSDRNLKEQAAVALLHCFEVSERVRGCVRKPERARRICSSDCAKSEHFVRISGAMVDGEDIFAAVVINDELLSAVKNGLSYCQLGLPIYWNFDTIRMQIRFFSQLWQFREKLVSVYCVVGKIWDRGRTAQSDCIGESGQRCEEVDVGFHIRNC